MGFRLISQSKAAKVMTMADERQPAGREAALREVSCDVAGSSPGAVDQPKRRQPRKLANDEVEDAADDEEGEFS